MIRIAEDLYTWRVTYRLSQHDAAQLLGVNTRTLGRWERGEGAPTEQNYEEIRRLIAQPPPGWIR